MIHPRQWMSFYSYIFKPGDFIKGYCFNISWMDECTHWWNTGKNEAHTAWNDHSLSFPNMFSNSVFYMQSKKQLGVFWAFWHNVFYSSASEETERRMHAFKWQENGCWDFQLGGEKWDVTVSECAAWRKLETRQKCVYLCQLVSWPSSRLPLPSVRREN